MTGLILFGGSFNPVHCGHLHAARAALAATGAARLLFIPTGQPPLRARRDLAPGRHRLAMLQAAIAGEPAMAVSDIEIGRDGPSYTVDTVELLAGAPGSTGPLYFLLGADCLAFLPGWRGIDRLHQRLRFAILPRDDIDLAGIDPRLLPIAMAPSPISATMVRARVAAGQSLAGMVPAAVAAYIDQHQLYRAMPATTPSAGANHVQPV